MKQIPIHSTPNADTRTSKDPISKEALKKDTELHILDVKSAMTEIANEIINRAERHDHTKIDYFNEFHANFIAEQTGEVKFKENTWWKKHLEERHHLTERVPADVNLFDIIELIADCNAAGLARSGKVYDMKLPDEVLQNAFANTFSYVNNHMSKCDIDSINKGV